MEEANEALPFQASAPVAFQMDEGLTPLQMVAELAAEGNPPGQRVSYILSIPAVAADCSLEEARGLLLPLISQLVFDDHPDIKQATAEVLGPLGPILASKDPAVAETGGSEDALDLLSLSQRLLLDPERAVQEAAAASVAQFAGLLSHEHRRVHLTAVIEELMCNYDDEQMQECAVDVLTKVACTAGAAHPGWCEECALPRMLKLAMHRDYNIRVHSVSGLVQLAACLPEEVRCGEVISTFADLCDDKVWSVRQDCATGLAAMASGLPREAVRDRLLPLWQKLSADVSAWAAAAAKRQAGQLLASIHPDDCTDALLECYVAAATGPVTLTEACAHYMPAVLRNLGVERWPQLKDAVVALAASDYVSVRVALAECMAELAALLGQQRVADDLLPVINRLSADQHCAVTDALAVNIRALLTALPREARLGQLGFLARMHPEDGASCGQWRMRLLIAQQLAGIAALLEQQGLAEVLLPATLRLCEDPVAAVREAAAVQLGSMVRGLLAQAAGSTDASEGEEEAATPMATAAAPEEEQQEAAAAVPPAAPEPNAAAGEPGGEQQEQQDAHQLQGEQQTQEQQDAQPQQQEQLADQEEVDQDEAHHVPAQRAGSPAAVVQQIVRHLVELQRSGRHRSRQTYIVFCAALLLPQPQPGAAAEGAAAAASTEQQQQQQATAQAYAWPALPEAVACSGITQGLLEGAVALAADPVPNVRLSVARLLAALQRQQPRVAGSSPKVPAALASLAADADRDVQAVASGAP